MLKKPYRIIKKKDFEAIYKKSRFLNSRLFLLRYRKNGLKNSRFGFVVSTKVSKRAVDRNRIKRMVREIVRFHLADIKDGFDVAFIIKKEILGVQYGDLELAMLNSLKSSGLI